MMDTYSPLGFKNKVEFHAFPTWCFNPYLRLFIQIVYNYVATVISANKNKPYKTFHSIN